MKNTHDITIYIYICIYTLSSINWGRIIAHFLLIEMWIYNIHCYVAYCHIITHLTDSSFFIFADMEFFILQSDVLKTSGKN